MLQIQGVLDQSCGGRADGRRQFRAVGLEDDQIGARDVVVHRFLSDCLKVADHSKDFGVVGGGIILKWILKKWRDS